VLGSFCKCQEPDWWGSTPLHEAAASGHVEVCKIMGHLEKKNPAMDNGWTVLHQATSDGNVELCKLMMDHLDEKNPCDDKRWTPWHEAAIKGHVAVCQLKMDYCNDGDDAWPLCTMQHTMDMSRYVTWSSKMLRPNIQETKMATLRLLMHMMMWDSSKNKCKILILNSTLSKFCSNSGLEQFHTLMI